MPPARIMPFMIIYQSRYDFHKTMGLKYLNYSFKDLGVD